jgi:hypothetical protein
MSGLNKSHSSATLGPDRAVRQGELDNAFLLRLGRELEDLARDGASRIINLSQISPRIQVDSIDAFANSAVVKDGRYVIPADVYVHYWLDDLPEDQVYDDVFPLEIVLSDQASPKIEKAIADISAVAG